MNKTWSFIDSDGNVTGRRFTGSESMLALNTPEGCTAVEGALLSTRRDDPELQRSRTLAQIEALERQQLRPLRELARNPDDAEARRRLDSIDAQIATLRAQLQ